MIQSLAFSPDGTRLASGSFREVKLWKRETVTADSPAVAAPKPADEALLKKIAEAGKVAILNHQPSADGKVIVTGCADGSVRVWDVASAKSLADLRGSAALTKEMAAHEWTVARESRRSRKPKSPRSRHRTRLSTNC
jgi:WD40 repeat protein